MKRSALWATCAVALMSAAASAQFWARTWDSIDWYTWPDPSVEGSVWVGVYGEWPTEVSFIPDFAMVTAAGSSVFVDVFDAFAQETALPGPTPFDLGDFVSLAPGWYNLYVGQYSNLWPLPAVGYDYVRGYDYLTTFPVYYRADLDQDGNVDAVDLAIFSDSWDKVPPDPAFNPICDLDEDGSVNVVDLLLLAKDWGKTIWLAM